MELRDQWERVAALEDVLEVKEARIEELAEAVAHLGRSFIDQCAVKHDEDPVGQVVHLGPRAFTDQRAGKKIECEGVGPV